MNPAYKSQKEITIIFRYDDVSSLTPVWLEKEIIKVFSAHGICLTMGVIPYVTQGGYHDPEWQEEVKLTSEKIEILKKAAFENKIEVALHGYNHRTRCESQETGLHSEFKGMVYEEQGRKIRKGKALLETELESKVETFIPPWNSYDSNTLRALIAEGIRNISANRYGPLLEWGEEMALQYIPVTIELHDIRKAVSKARKLLSTGATIVVLLHPYDFKESGDDRGRLSIDELGEVLTWLRSEPDLTLVSVSRAGENGRYDFRRYEANRPPKFENIYPPFIKSTYYEPLYLSLKDANRRNLFKMTFAGLVILFVGFLGATGGWGLGALWSYKQINLSNMWHAFLIVSLGSLIFVIAILKPTFNRVAMATCLLSGIAGALIKRVL